MPSMGITLVTSFLKKTGAMHLLVADFLIVCVIFHAARAQQLITIQRNNQPYRSLIILIRNAARCQSH